MPDRTRVDRCVILRCDDKSCTVSIDLDVRMPLGLRVHRGECKAVIRMLMTRSAGTFVKSNQSCVFDPDSRQAAENLAHDIRERFFRIAHKPVSQRQVEDVLSITSRERIRWGKDGRLPRSGTARIRKGRTEISLWTYPCDAIERLAADPAEISRWRETDEATTSIGVAAIFV
ncbi:hypothetical protein [Novosphingobium kunmingense]|uniref:hypothetical protein n=1 Tax=Novosphingobium kunmingense TaxID=1211806 RepID=UPI0012FD21AB|nr:hypothetical protein [Novosphingobium kunmingense]